jgi:tRNA G18 (ribose-2'-O)-methylase SpoU
LSTGFFGIAVYHPKHEVNVGTLWRSAMTYDAALLATVGRRYRSQASDTCKAPKSIPLQHFADIDALIEGLPHSCPLIGVELDSRSEDLEYFEHPARGLYLLGAEDHGLPPEILDRCHRVIKVESAEPWSLNLAVAGSIVMRDRYIKTQTRSLVTAAEMRAYAASLPTTMAS